ncbi:Pyridoxal phosphate-dependent transferase [Pseudocohnilembus persalinus]|uniref:glycine hydroxymethyltransferase n=1 Tax=Pseudocohnilembus persalinus TaxID=266149 RepID=A0A0V0QRY5_PSEPJ|nr:Pyridoxal phosphate-dependent transferase [Pseudocohnilembus persalinus]|eukprot:KRX05059.1 Pyridoxal phosphate-dependent transferase [Pseudocohnilembus persalinus]
MDSYNSNQSNQNQNNNNNLIIHNNGQLLNQQKTKNFVQFQNQLQNNNVSKIGQNNLVPLKKINSNNNRVPLKFSNIYLVLQTDSGNNSDNDKKSVQSDQSYIQEEIKEEINILSSSDKLNKGFETSENFFENSSNSLNFNVLSLQNSKDDLKYDNKNKFNDTLKNQQISYQNNCDQLNFNNINQQFSSQYITSNGEETPQDQNDNKENIRNEKDQYNNNFNRVGDLNQQNYYQYNKKISVQKRFKNYNNQQNYNININPQRNKSIENQFQDTKQNLKQDDLLKENNIQMCQNLQQITVIISQLTNYPRQDQLNQQSYTQYNPCLNQKILCVTLQEYDQNYINGKIQDNLLENIEKFFHDKNQLQFGKQNNSRELKTQQISTQNIKPVFKNHQDKNQILKNDQMNQQQLNNQNKDINNSQLQQQQQQQQEETFLNRQQQQFKIIIGQQNQKKSKQEQEADQIKFQEEFKHQKQLLDQQIKESKLLNDDEELNVKIGDLIGEGAYGKVYEGMIRNTGRFIAVKIMQMNPVQNDIAPLKITTKEIALLKKLDHPNIVKYYGCKQYDEHIQIYMEHMQGGSLNSMLKQYGKLQENLIKKFTKQILNGLQYLHEQNIVHRDLKAANILTDKHGNAKLADFGAARRFDKDVIDILSASQSDQFCKSIQGSIRWMAPEILNGEPHGFRIDTWSLGCTIIELASGQAPWNECKSLPELICKIMEKRQPPIPCDLSEDSQYKQMIQRQIIRQSKNIQKKLNFCNKQNITVEQQQLNQGLKEYDPELFQMIQQEVQNQKKSINLIASENTPSLATMSFVGSIMNAKYSEGYPGQRYYGGTQHIDEMEVLTQKRALEAFNLDKKQWGVNVQPLSGSVANFAAVSGVLDCHERMMSLKGSHGGDQSCGYVKHGKTLSQFDKHFTVLPYFTNQQGIIDYDNLLIMAKNFKPKVITSDCFSYSRVISWSQLRKIADEVGALLIVNISQSASLYATGELESPFEYADIVTTASQGSLRGNRGGMIFYKIGKKEDGTSYDFQAKIDQALFPGIQGGPHNHSITALGHTLKEVKSEQFQQYAKQTVQNMSVFCRYLQELGYQIVSGGSDTNLCVVDLRNTKSNGSELSQILEQAHIFAQKTRLPQDLDFEICSGLRLSTSYMTSRGCDQNDFIEIANLFHKGVSLTTDIVSGYGYDYNTEDFHKYLRENLSSHKELNTLKKQVEDFAAQFPFESGQF